MDASATAHFIRMGDARTRRLSKPTWDAEDLHKSYGSALAAVSEEVSVAEDTSDSSGDEGVTRGSRTPVKGAAEGEGGKVEELGPSPASGSGHVRRSSVRLRHAEQQRNQEVGVRRVAVLSAPVCHAGCAHHALGTTRVRLLSMAVPSLGSRMCPPPCPRVVSCRVGVAVAHGWPVQVLDKALVTAKEKGLKKCITHLIVKDYIKSTGHDIAAFLRVYVVPGSAARVAVVRCCSRHTLYLQQHNTGPPPRSAFPRPLTRVTSRAARAVATSQARRQDRRP